MWMYGDVCLHLHKYIYIKFLEQIDKIFAACTHTSLQRAMFSATLPENVEELARTVLVDPIRIVIGTRNAGASSIDQKLVFVGREQGKLLAIQQIIKVCTLICVCVYSYLSNNNNPHLHLHTHIYIYIYIYILILF